MDHKAAMNINKPLIWHCLRHTTISSERFGFGGLCSALWHSDQARFSMTLTYIHVGLGFPKRVLASSPVLFVSFVSLFSPEFCTKQDASSSWAGQVARQRRTNYASTGSRCTECYLQYNNITFGKEQIPASNVSFYRVNSLDCPFWCAMKVDSLLMSLPILIVGAAGGGGGWLAKKPLSRT